MPHAALTLKDNDALAEATTPPQAFSLTPVNRGTEPMLDLRFKTGDRLALGYVYLLSIGFNPSEGITLVFTSHTVHIRGRCLAPLYEGLAGHRVGYVAEQHLHPMEVAEEKPWIERIMVEE